jgi:YhgE/Pip-like protein
MTKQDLFSIFLKELSLFKGRPMLWVAAVTIAFLPALYTVIYLGAVWDPYARLNRLPAGLVVLDEGVNYRGKDYDLGQDLTARLKQERPFQFFSLANETAGEEAVRSGAAYFTVIIPKDFSRKALPGNESASLQLVTSQGTSFISDLMAKRFVDEVVKKLNDQIALERWRAVLSSSKDVKSAVDQLKSGSDSLLIGSQELNAGLEKASQGSLKLLEGEKKLTEGLTRIDIKALVEKGEELHSGSARLADGLASHLLTGALLALPLGLPSAKELKTLAEGARTYQGKIQELGTGLEKAQAGSKQIVENTGQLSEGLLKLQTGSKMLENGMDRLHEGLELFSKSIPPEDKKAEDLAVPVFWLQKDLAPIASNGQGFAPYFTSLSLWIGVVVSSFLFYIRVLPQSFRSASRTAKIFGKGAVPAVICLTSALIVGLILQAGLKVSVQDWIGFYCVLFLSTLTYTAIVLALIRLIGDAGKLISVIFLVIQIAASGGAYPIQLSPLVYQIIGPHFPLTFSVMGLRAAMFGSYYGDWIHYCLLFLPWLFISWAVSYLAAGRIKYIEDDRYGPAIDFSHR